MGMLKTLSIVLARLSISSTLRITYQNIYLRNKETQQSLQYIVNIKCNAIGCVDDDAHGIRIRGSSNKE